MMKKKINHLFRSLALLFMAGVVCCCADDRESFRLPDDPLKEVTFSVQIPVPSVPGTYGLNATDENHVKTIDVLLFSSGSGNLIGSSLSANSITDDGAVNKKVFTLKIPEGTYTVVILANCRDILTAAMPGITADANKSKANVLSKLQVSMPTGAWVADATSSSYKHFPMWGEIVSLPVGPSTPASNPVKLIRMLAKIDVSVNGSLRNDFKLTSVRLYNRYTQGYVAPLAANWSAAQSKVTAPSPLGSISTIALPYTVPTPFAQFLNEIYTFEAPAYNGTPAVIPEHTCLIIGGKYKGSAETFYRVDFARITGSSVTYLPLLRNHRYDVDIKTIEAAGYPSHADALLNRAVNIEADITVFDESKITKTVYDDQNMLGVSNDNITFTREARTLVHNDNTLSVTTDVVTGWKLAKVVDATTGLTVSWVSLNPDNKSTVGTFDTKLILSDNTSGGSRSAVIHLVAGRLTLPVTITQTTASALMLSITNASNTDIADLVFVAAADEVPPVQSIKLSWMPTGRPVDVVSAAFGGNPFVYNSTSLNKPGTTEMSYIDASGSGTKTLSIQPAAITTTELIGNPFLEKISKVDFKVNNGAGGYISKSIFFRQFAYNFVVQETTGFYRLDGSTYTLRVKSNVGWKISSVTPTITSGTGSLLQSANELYAGFTGGANTNPGTAVTFKVANNVSTLEGTITIKFVSTDNPIRFLEKTHTLNLTGEYYPTPHKGWAGSNIYWDGSKLTFDDVNDQSRHNYQGIYFQWGSLWGLDPSGSNNSAWTNRVYKLNSGSYSYTTSAYVPVPRVNDATINSNAPSGKSERDRAYLYEITNESTGVGDICKYLTEKGWAPGGAGTKWRMPTSMEFEAAASYSYSGSWGYPTSNDQSGKYQNPSIPGATKTPTSGGTYPNAFFPASGRRGTNGQLANVGFYGYYWAGSPNGANAYYLYFTNGSVSPAGSSYRQNSYPVRCVRE